MDNALVPGTIARIKAYRRSGCAIVAVIRDGRARRYRVSLERYRRLRDWSMGKGGGWLQAERGRPFYSSGAWLKSGFDAHFWPVIKP